MKKNKSTKKFNYEKSNKTILHDPATGIIYDTSGIDPEMRKILDEFEEANKRDPNIEVIKYVKPKKRN